MTTTQADPPRKDEWRNLQGTWCRPGSACITTLPSGLLAVSAIVWDAQQNSTRRIIDTSNCPFLALAVRAQVNE